MTKSDLRTGMRVTKRDGTKLIVMLNCNYGCDYSCNILVNNIEYCWHDLRFYNEDLTHEKYREDDIVKVEQPNHPYQIFFLDSNKFTTIWQRPEHKEMTLADIEKELGYPVKIIK